MLASLGTMWLMTDVIHFGETDAASLKAPAALSRIDSQGILFFLGILMSVSCLNAAGILGQLSSWLITNLPFKSMLAAAIGLASAVIDNVPIVAATMGMYSQDTMPINDTFWHLVAYCAGTGGSIMIVGSASGLAFMGIEGVEFGWYAKRIGGFAASGYFAGMAVYMVVQPVLAMWGVVP
jgi:Na+/H+ antiporter NhaD/arsenite permease-like protein